jgi:hypothetical protein
VLKEHKQHDRIYGLEKLWAFHHYKSFPKGCKLQIHPEVQTVTVIPHFDSVLLHQCLVSHLTQYFNILKELRSDYQDVRLVMSFFSCYCCQCILCALMTK